MSTFTPLTIASYRKTQPPVDAKSALVYQDQQLQNIERSVRSLEASIKQLQDEMALIWTALNALGQTRP